MDKRPSWWKIFHPDLTGGLIAIIIFLLLSAIGNVFKLYDAMVAQDFTGAGWTTIAALLYAVPAFGLLRLKRWARIFEIGFSIVMVLLGLLIAAVYLPMAGGIIILTHGAVAYYLWKSKKIFYPEQ